MKIQLIIMMLLISITLSAQKSLKKGNQAYDKLEYYKAIEHYTDYLDDKEDQNIRERLAESYLRTNQYHLAENEYRQLVNHNGALRLTYGKILLVNGKVEAAKEQVEIYLKKNSENEAALRLLRSCNKMDQFTADVDKYEIRRNDFVEGTSNYSPVYYGDLIVFTTDAGGKRDDWTGRSYSNIYIHDPVSGKHTAIEGNINGKYHNGVVAFRGEDYMIYTRNSDHKNDNKQYNLILAEARRVGNEWKFTKYFDYNDAELYNVAYPTISPDGQILVFASDRPDGKGGWDLYKSQWTGSAWSTPVNLTQLNTTGNEMFPNYSQHGFSFASDGYIGMGGLDIYATSLDLDDVPKHIGAPFNSHRDDFGLITSDRMKSGYFTSNRDDRSGLDHIYYFTRLPENLRLAGVVLDEYTRIPLKETLVKLELIATGETQEIITGTDGRFTFEVQSDQAYHLHGIKNDIKTTEENFTADSGDENLYFTLLHNDPRFSLEGYAQNAADQSGVQGVTVTNFNTTSQRSDRAMSDATGFFKFQLEQNSDFEISGEKDGHYTSISTASTKGLDRSQTLYVKLYLTMKEVVIGETVIMGKQNLGGWTFDPLYYDLDKAHIRPDAALVLDEVVEFLTINPGLIIELGSHTDSRGGQKYNQDLSSQRAASAIEYLVSKGINKARLTSRGYGESVLVNHCADEIHCSEELHQMNRRTEIKVIGNQ